MPILSALLEAEGALVDVLVGVSDASVRSLRTSLRPIPAAIRARALIDTGAEATCLDSSIVIGLGLPVAGFSFANLPSAGGLTIGTQHDANVTVVHPSGNAGHNLEFRDVLIIDLALTNLGYQ